MEFKEQMNMILCKFHSLNFIPLLHANIFKDQLAILFYSLIIEYFVSILRHQYDVVGNLTIAMAKAAQFQCLSHPSHRWVAPPVAKVPRISRLKKVIYYRLEWKKSARVHFIPDLKVGVFVTLRTPIVIKFTLLKRDNEIPLNTANCLSSNPLPIYHSY